MNQFSGEPNSRRRWVSGDIEADIPSTSEPTGRGETATPSVTRPRTRARPILVCRSDAAPCSFHQLLGRLPVAFGEQQEQQHLEGLVVELHVAAVAELAACRMAAPGIGRPG